MNLYTDTDVRPDKSGVLCRQSRVWGTIIYTLLCVLLVGAPVVWWRLEAPWPVWGGCGLLALLVVPLLVGDLLLRLRSSSWVLWIRPDGLWINFRSYQDQFCDETASVVHVESPEIAQVQRQVESYSTPGRHHGNSSVHHSEQSLLIHLNHSDSEPLQEAIAAERSRPPTVRTVLGFISVVSKVTHFAVTMPSPTLIRIAWRGRHGDHVVPSLDSAIGHLERIAGILSADAVRQDRPDWQEMDESQIDEQIRHLVDSGARLQAIRLLVRRKGYTTTEARRHIQELTRHPSRVPEN